MIMREPIDHRGIRAASIARPNAIGH